jgi:hypothetical protein
MAMPLSAPAMAESFAMAVCVWVFGFVVVSALCIFVCVSLLNLFLVDGGILVYITFFIVVLIITIIIIICHFNII